MKIFRNEDRLSSLAKVQLEIPVTAAVAEQLVLMDEIGIPNFKLHLDYLHNDGATLVISKFLQPSKPISSDYASEGVDYDYPDEYYHYPNEDEDEDEDYEDEEADYDDDDEEIAESTYAFGTGLSEYMFVKRPF